jgi:hypothetical protein
MIMFMIAEASPPVRGARNPERARRAIKGAGGKRLTYRRTRSQAKEAGAA